MLKLLDYFLENHAVMLFRSGKFFFNRKVKDFFQDGENEIQGPHSPLVTILVLYNESVLLTAKSSPVHKSRQNEITP